MFSPLTKHYVAVVMKIITLIFFLVLSPVFVFAEESQSLSIERPSPGSWKGGFFEWYYNPNNRPVWLTNDKAIELLKQSARVWEACGVKMVFKGYSKHQPGRIDGINVVGWSKRLNKNLRGLTIGRARRGLLLERDILIRPDRREFKRFPRLLRKVITHEFGHAIGLTHSSNCNDVMTLAASCPKAHPRTLPIQLTSYDLQRCQEVYSH